MNEELKIIISAVTDGAKKSIHDVKQELKGVSGSAQSASKGFGAAMKGIGKGALIAVGAIAAVGAAVVALGKKSLELQRSQAKLETAFQSMGSSASQAAESYKGLFRFLGDADTSVEAASHLAKLTTNQKELAEWTKVCQGIYATFGDSLKIESLTEAANETARVGKVTGTLADALNWAGVSEDEFNAKLANTTSFEEREALIRGILNDLYKDASDIYENNNKALLEYNESQARLDSSLGRAGAAVKPLLTALNNLSAALLNALKPALDLIVPAISTFVGWITKGIEAALGFFSVLSGGSATVKTFTQMGAGIDSAAGSADKLTSGLEGAAVAAEKAKRATMGFDELNVLSTGSSSSGTGAESGATAPGYMTPIVDASKFTVEVEETKGKASGFAKTITDIAEKLKDVFAPTVTAWTNGFGTIKKSWNETKDSFINGGTGIKNGFKSLVGYVTTEFVPDLVNSFSTNLAPVLTEVLGFAFTDAGKNFDTIGQLFGNVVNNILTPALELYKSIYTDMWESIGKVWEDKGQPILDGWAKATEHIRSTVVTVYEQYIEPTVNKLIGAVQKAWDETLKPVYEEVVEAFAEIGRCLLQLYNDFIAPIIDWIVENVLPVIQPIIDNLIEYFGKLLANIGSIIGSIIGILEGIIQFITGIFTGDWDLAWTGIENIFNNVWDTIVGIAATALDTIKQIFDPEAAGEFFSGVWAAIQSALAGVSKWFKNLFSGGWEGVEEAFSGAGNWFGDRWTDIKNAFGTVGKWFGDTFGVGYKKAKGAFDDAGSNTRGFGKVWSNIKGAFSGVGYWFESTFSGAWEKVKGVFSTDSNIFTDIGDSLLSGLKTIINDLIDGINDIIEEPFKGINTALGKIKNISILGAKPFNWIGTITVPQIPKLAKGGVFDQATLAMIGEKGKEAVVPLENNTAWMDKLVAKLTAMTNTPSKIVLMLDDKELGWANINSINNITRQAGALQLVMA